MRLFLLFLLIVLFAFAQTGVAPVPTDRYELVTGAVQIPSTPADRAAVLSLLERARQNGDMHMPGTPPFRIRVAFTASGNTAYVGSGEMSEIWFSGQRWRYNQSLGDYSETRLRAAGANLVQRAGSVPMRVAMLRASLFWPIGLNTSGMTLRSAAAQWNNRPVTCVLASGSTDATPGRHWVETEHCVDNASGLLMIESRAPSTFAVYSYNKGLQFHGRSVPDQISIYLGGSTVIETQTVEIADATPADEQQLTPTPGMVSGGPVSAGMNIRFPLVTGNSTGIDKPAIVHVMIDPQGHVAEEELSAAADSSVADSALELVKKTNFGPSPVQREAYINVRQGVPRESAPR